MLLVPGRDRRRQLEAPLGVVEQPCGRDLVRARQALAAFEKSLEAKPDDPSIRYRYALALEALDRDDEALEALQRALQTGPFPEVEQARAQVAKLASREGSPQ